MFWSTPSTKQVHFLISFFCVGDISTLCHNKSNPCEILCCGLYHEISKFSRRRKFLDLFFYNQGTWISGRIVSPQYKYVIELGSESSLWLGEELFFFFHNDFYIEEVLCVKVCMFVFMFAMFYIDLEYVEQRPQPAHKYLNVTCNSRILILQLNEHVNFISAGHGDSNSGQIRVRLHQ